jgi:hypothetical protein
MWEEQVGRSSPKQKFKTLSEKYLKRKTDYGAGVGGGRGGRDCSSSRVPAYA